MDETSSLLLTLVQTKSIERALAPIASQVSQLVLQNEAYESGDVDAFPADLQTRATHVAESSKQLILAGNRLLTQTSDQELAHQMPRACESLDVAGDLLVTAAQRLYAEELSRGARRHLVRSAKDVLEATLRVLLVSDDAEVRRIQARCHDARRRLHALTTIGDMTQLVAAFKDFSENVTQLTKLVEKRQRDLADKRQREAVLAAMGLLRKCLPMLSTALQTSVKYPLSAQAMTSKELATGQIIECLEQINTLLQSKQSVASCDDADDPGYFVVTMDKVLDALSDSRRTQMVSADSDLDQHIGAMIRHAMSVAHFSGQSRRKHVISSCQRILEQRNQLSEFVTSLECSPYNEPLVQEFNESCDHLVHLLKRLEEDISLAVLHLVCDVCKESTEPLERLVRAALTQHQLSEECMRTYRESFHGHADALCQVARFVAAGCPHAKKVRELQSCITQLEHLDPEILPAIAACMQSSADPGTQQNPGSTQSHPGDTQPHPGTTQQYPGATQQHPGATQHLKLLKREWNINVDLLLDCIDGVIDHSKFMEIAESKLRDHVRECRKSRQLDVTSLTRVTRAVAGTARRVATVAKLLGDKCGDDAVERRDVHQTIAKFKQNIQGFKSSASRALSESAAYEQHEELQQQCDSLLAGLSRVTFALAHGHDSFSPLSASDEILQLNDGSGIQNGGPDVAVAPVVISPGPAPRGLAEVLPMTSQISLQGLTLYGQPWNGKEQGFLRPNTSKAETQKKPTKSFFSSGSPHRGAEEVCRLLVSSATAGDKDKLDVLVNDLLKWTNHSSDVVKLLLPVLADDLLKERLEEASGVLSPDVATCVALSARLLDCDTSCLEELHEATEHWLGAVSYVMREVDKVLEHWLIYSNKIVNSAKEKNAKLTAAQMVLLRKHVTSTLEVGGAAQLLSSNHNDVPSSRLVLVLHDRCQHLQTLTNQLQSLANAAVEPDVWQLERVSREWAVNVYVILRSCHVISCQQLELFRRQLPATDVADVLQLKKELDLYTQDTLRVKALVEEIEERMKNASLRGITEQLEKVLLCMEDCLELLATAVVPFPKQHETMYAPYNLLLLKWSWCNKVQEILERMENLNESNYSIESLLCREDDIKEGLLAHMAKVRKKAVEAMKPCHATDRRQAVQATLLDMENLTSQLAHVTASADDRVKVLCMTRRWSILCYHLTSQMHDLNSANQVALKDLHKLLCGPSLDHVQPKPRNNAEDAHDHAVNVPHARPENARSHASFASQNGSQHPKATSESKDKGMRHSYVPPTRAKDSPDVSWRELAKTPRVQHSTPEAPSSPAPLVQLRKTPKPASDGRLASEMDRWEEDGNPVVQLARQIATQVGHMEGYLKGQGPIQGHAEVISTAKDVAAKSEKLVKFVRILVDHSVDKRCAENLSRKCERAPMLTAQLYILSASVPGCPADELATEGMLVHAARNLADAFSAMLTAAEAICVKGLRKPAPEAGDEVEAVVMATKWKRRIEQHRSHQSACALKDELGLRKVTQSTRAPALNHIMSDKQ